MSRLFTVLKSAHWLLFGSQVFSFLTIFFNIALLATSAWLISKAALHPVLAALGLAIVGVRFYGISRAVSRYVERYLSHNMAFQGLYALRTWLYSVIEPLAPALFRKYSSGDLLGRLMADIEILQFFYLRVLIPPITAIAITLIFGIYLGFFTPWLSLLLGLAFVVSGIVLPLLSVHWREEGARELLQQRAQVKGALVETLNGILDIVAYNSRDLVQHKLEEEYALESVHKNKIGHGANLGSTLFVASVQITMLLGLLIMAHKLTHSSISGVYLAVVAIGIQAYFEALQPMNDVYYHWRESKRAMKRLTDLEAEPLPVHDPVKPVTLSKNIVPSLECKDVTFAYGEQTLFQNLTVTVPAGAHVAIVGPSGSGKTTFFNMIERFYPYKGSLKASSVELRDMTQEEWRSHFSMVDQSPYIFHATLEDNIRLANPKATQEELEEAIRKAALEGLVSEVGLQTMVGGGGSQLSGGERQRIALARLYLQNHNLWLLDEPLEGLDQKTRKIIYDQLRKEMKGKTVLLITHQLKGLEEMDAIFFMERGTIKEAGTYEELMAKKGDFYRYITMSMSAL